MQTHVILLQVEFKTTCVSQVKPLLSFMFLRLDKYGKSTRGMHAVFHENRGHFHMRVQAHLCPPQTKLPVPFVTSMFTTSQPPDVLHAKAHVNMPAMASNFTCDRRNRRKINVALKYMEPTGTFACYVNLPALLLQCNVSD